jgi:hypothetical protein
MRAMPRFRRVDTYPPTGFPDRMWGSHPEGPGEPVVDAFLRASRPVVELYSGALGGVDLHGPRGSLVLHPGAHLGGDDGPVSVRVWSAQPHDMPSETGFVGLPASVGRLDAAGRARLALEAVHAGVVRLAAVRGWDSERLEACRKHVLDNDLTYAWAGPWKASPDRRHQARATYRLGALDGFGRARLEVRRRADEEVVVTSDEAVAFCTAAGLERSAGTLRWTGPHEVGLTPYVGLVRPHDGGRLVARSSDGRWEVELPGPVAVRTPGGDGIDEDPAAPLPEVVAELT